MAQYARPDADVSAGSWTPYPASPATLYDKISETSHDDATTYITTTAAATTCEVGLSNVTDPVSSTGHILYFWATATGSGGGEKITMLLFESTTQRATSGAKTITRTTWNEYTYTLSAAEADAITNYSNLTIKLTSAQTAGETLKVTQAYLEVPTAVTTYSVTIAVSMALAPALTRVVTFKRSIAVSTALSSAINRLITFHPTIAVSLALLRSLERVVTFKRGIAVSLGLSPALGRVITRVKSFGASLALSPSITRTVTFVRGIAASLALVPSIVYELTQAGGGTLYNVTIAVSLALSPAFSFVHSLSGLYARAVSLAVAAKTLVKSITAKTVTESIADKDIEVD